jgi:hypothetical protein
VRDNDTTDRDDIPGDAAREDKGRLAGDVAGRGDSPEPDTGATHGQPQRPDRGASHVPGRGDVTARGIGDNPSQAVPTEKVAAMTVPEGGIPGPRDGEVPRSRRVPAWTPAATSEAPPMWQDRTAAPCSSQPRTRARQSMAVKETSLRSAFRDTAHVNRLKAAVLPWLVRSARRMHSIWCGAWIWAEPA